MLTASLCLPAFFVLFMQSVPTIKVASDNVVIDKSCRVVIPAKTVIEDSDGDGVIHIAASDITIEFAEGSVLRGAAPNTRPDEYRGYGVRINGYQNVTIRNACISGFWCGLWATDADGLTRAGVDASDNRRAYLKSTPTAEDGGDWLSPHNNDGNEWLNNYGAAIYVEQSDGVTIRKCKVWNGQNALLLDRVNDSKIYDNDFSFNSGWGLGLWRSSRNVITRNAFDFCVRGYSHGVYNRGQDSAGILMFEQNNENIIAENSATHGGDGFFGFAGREALGETGEGTVEFCKRRGNNDNLLINNDFSYAPAHGIEMTFSFGNIFAGNRLVGNAICGVWGGYSQDTLITSNTFADNGEMGYGLERGGVNIEHGKGNRIVDNTFRDNKCGVHLWWDPDEGFAEKPWAKANGVESTNNIIASNKFNGGPLAFHFRGKSDVTIAPNEIENVEKELEADAEVDVRRVPIEDVGPIEVPEYPVYGEMRPVGARKHLCGRENIVMTEWGPWDHQAPLIRVVEDTGDSITYDMLNMPDEVKCEMLGVLLERRPAAGGAGKGGRYRVHANKPGVYPFTMKVSAGDFEESIQGTLISTRWQARFFKWTKDIDPREDLSGWRKLADGPGAVAAEAGRLQFKYGFGGPSDTNLSQGLTEGKLGGDHFGMIARTRLPLPAGKWKFTTQSDDGVRVTIDGKPVIENWTWHGPTKNEGVFELSTDKTVEIIVEHFEIDGFAVLELGIAASE
ncbi:MAG: right-handed parallel beta-helix repeat-containing protein [Planctomycetota bacterium]